jgi:hypothetical protein
MSVLEWHFVDDGSNEDVEAEILTPLDKDIEAAFPNVALLKLPVLLDRVPNLPSADAKADPKRNLSRTVKNFLPNAANFQTLGDRILVPRPYGPRMKPNSVAIVLKAVFEANKIKGTLPTLNEAYFKKRGLLNTIAWLNADLDGRPAGTISSRRTASLFRDGLPKGLKIDEAFQLIKRANPGAFLPNGDLRSGWQRLSIPDGSVDLFEAAIQVQFESVGAVPRFVDSWHYHTHGGQIHCGTNVLRKPRPAPKG